jgi:hypothetical protein
MKDSSKMQSQNTNIMGMTGVPEVDRLLKEREDLITSMGYEPNDPLIQELDR